MDRRAAETNGLRRASHLPLGAVRVPASSHVAKDVARYLLRMQKRFTLEHITMDVRRPTLDHSGVSLACEPTVGTA